MTCSHQPGLAATRLNAAARIARSTSSRPPANTPGSRSPARMCCSASHKWRQSAVFCNGSMRDRNSRRAPSSSRVSSAGRVRGCQVRHDFRVARLGYQLGYGSSNAHIARDFQPQQQGHDHPVDAVFDRTQSTRQDHGYQIAADHEQATPDQKLNGASRRLQALGVCRILLLAQMPKLIRCSWTATTVSPRIFSLPQISSANRLNMPSTLSVHRDTS